MRTTRFVKAILATLLLASVAPAFASDDNFLGSETPGAAVLSGFRSKHLNSKSNFRENNEGIGIRTTEGYALGYYKNSDFHDSVYVGREFQWKVVGPLYVGMTAGLLSGYRRSVFPFLLPEVLLKTEYLEVAATVMPPLGQQSPAAIAAQVRIRF
jgi:hypothetical protein